MVFRGHRKPLRATGDRRVGNRPDHMRAESYFMTKINEFVLVVDDSPTTRRVISTLLKRIGYGDIDEAENGAEGFEKAAQCQQEDRPYSLIVSDWAMEPMNGIELVTKLRGDEDLAETPVIMVSSADRVEDVVRAKAAGFDAYIVKPFDASSLRDKITWVKSRQTAVA